MLFVKGKHQFLAVFVVLCMLVVMVIGLLPGSAINVYAATNYYVDGKAGNDHNKGTDKGAPFKTIQKASTIATGGSIVNIRAGTYGETITPTNSGSPGNVITYQNYNGEVVTVSGCDSITGWTQDSGSIYWAPLSWDLADKNQIFVNEVMMNEARWPNQAGTMLQPTFKTVDTGSSVADPTYFTDSDLTGGDDYWNGATLHIVSGYEWVWQTSVISDYVASTHKLTFGLFRYHPTYSAYEAWAGNRYYLDGLRSLLDTEKEWWYDSTNSRLYLWAPGGGSPTNVKVKHREVSFELSGRSYIQIKGINTLATKINMDDNTTHCLVKQCNLKYITHSDVDTAVGQDQDNLGILLKGSYNEINSCELAYSSGSLVSVLGLYNNVINCYIHDGGYHTDWDGMVCLKGANSLISNNTICDAGRACVTWNNSPNASLMRNCQIQYNNMYNCGWTTKDLGVMYSGWTDAENTAIHNNWIHDNKGGGPSGGLYLDAWDSNFIVYNNVVWAVPGISYLNNGPSNYNLFYNNTGWTDTGNINGFNFGVASGAHKGTRFFNNIIHGIEGMPNQCVKGNNITSAQSFVDEANHNYHLQSGSSGIDAGVIENGITDGYAGCAPDCGAYEYNGADWTWTPGHNFTTPPSPTFSSPYALHMNRIPNNAGFERGDLTGWTKTGALLATAVNECCDHVNVDTTGKDTAGYWGLQLGGSATVDGVERTILGLAPNTAYTLSGNLRSSNVETAALGVYNYGGSDTSKSSTSSTWTSNEVNFTTGPSNTSATIYLKKTSAGSNYIYCDVIGVQIAGDGVKVGWVDDDNDSVIYSGTWTDDNNIGSEDGYYNNNRHYTATTGDSCQLTFNGTSIKVYTEKYTYRGMADVYIDGTFDATVDGYKPEPAQAQAILYQKTGLSSGNHTIKIVCKGQKNANALSYTIVIDAFEYSGGSGVVTPTPSSGGSGGATPTPSPTATPTPSPTATPTLTPVTVSASSTYSTYVASLACDSDVSTRWNAYDVSPQWWKVDFGSAITVGRTELDLYDPTGRYYQYRVEISTDDSTYNTVVDRTSNTQYQTTLTDTFTPASARYVRVYFTGCSVVGWPGIYECRVFEN